MALPSTGPISMSQVRTEIGRSSGAISLGETAVRNLAGRASGVVSMSDLRGKSASTTTTFTVNMREYAREHCSYDPKIGQICFLEELRFGYNLAIMGSISPNTFRGVGILSAEVVMDVFNIGGGHPSYNVSLSGDSRGLIKTVQFEGESEWDAGEGRYSPSLGITTWQYTISGGTAAWAYVGSGTRRLILKG